ncbi:hypothetical protein [Chondromyces crocatus]|uniref:hypothetical protein n=1 Tax=Chondromyces crocatus TaxID=52 RepID=UPI0012E31F06|nr:hypothetical protein [Chondromyces crocatus]
MLELVHDDDRNATGTTQGIEIDLDVALVAVDALLSRALGHVRVGEHFRDEGDAIREFATVLELPKDYGPDYQNASWHSIDFYVGELQVRPETWRTRKSASGYILLYREPGHLISSDAPGFANLLTALGSGCERMAPDSLPTHLVVGPMTSRHEFFAGLLRVAKQFCAECLCVN